FAVLSVVAVDQVEVIAADQPGRDGILHQAQASVRGEVALPPAQAIDTDLVELLAHVVELSVEGGHRPVQPFGGFSGCRDLTSPWRRLPQYVLGQRHDQQALRGSERNGFDGRGAAGTASWRGRVEVVLRAVDGELVGRRPRDR